MKELDSFVKNESVNTTPVGELDEIFSQFSTQTQGLSEIINQGELKSIAESRDTLEEIIYTFKFIKNEFIFQDIIDAQAKDFFLIPQEQRDEILRYAKIFYNTLRNPPKIHDISKFDIGDTGSFIGYIFVDSKSVGGDKQKLHVIWKTKKESFPIFQKLLQCSNTQEDSFPKELRSFGDIAIIQENDTIVIQFSGDASITPKMLYSYNSTLLQHFREDLEIVFEAKDTFQGKRICMKF